METVKKKSVFMQMHDGERPGEGSFNVGLQKLFYLAATDSRVKLVRAFPEFFGDEVPEFGVTAVMVQTKTTHTIVLDIALLEQIVEKMKANVERDRYISTSAIFHLCLDTDWRSLVIDTEEAGEQFSGYAECNSTSIKLI
jgi:hypothetical protein